MDFGFIPVAEASVVTLMKSIDRVIINPIIFFLFALALVYFLFGVAQYLLSPENENIRKTSKTHMLYGVIGLFVMVAVFGIMNLILNTVGERRIKIQNTGDYEILKTGNDQNNFDMATVDSTSVDITTGAEDLSESKDLSGSKDLSYENGVKVDVTNFNTSPFKAEYIDNNFCWHKQFNATGDTEYKALKAVKALAKDSYIKDNAIKTEDINNVLPLNYGTLTAYDKSTKLYHVWMDARAPIKGGTVNNCVLPIKNIKELKFEDYVLGSSFSKLTDASTGPSLFTHPYYSDELFYRVEASGVNYLLQLARELAIKNAYFLLFGEILDIDINSVTVVYPTFRIIEEKYIFKNGKYEYWVALESAKDDGTPSDNTVLKPVSFKSPFSTPYDSSLFFTRIIDLATSKDLATARKIAIENALLKISKELENGAYKDLQFTIILEEKQIYNQTTGEYEYWVAVEGSKIVEGAKPVSESLKAIPFTKIYKTDVEYYRAVSSGVSKELSTAKELARNNALIKLSAEVGNSLTGTQMVTILEEKQVYNSVTGNYEYWVAVELKK